MTLLIRAWNRAPILLRVLAGNAIVILAGAIGGTVLTQHLLTLSVFWLALGFALAGIVLSLAINYAILRDALRPMDALQRAVEQIDCGDTIVRAPAEEIGDPQLQRFARALNTMLERLAARTRQIEANEARLRQLSGQVLRAQEEERKRLARELHDDTSGALARVLLNIEMCEDALPEEWTEIHDKMRATRVLTAQTLENIRQMIFDLRPTLLDDLGLAAAVRWYAKNSLEPAGVQVQFEASSDLGRASPSIETALFRIAQEAITNIVRHAGARHARIQLTRENSRWVFVAQDDGRGFDARAPLGEPHWGLFGIRERVEALGGAVAVESAVGKGTTLRVEIPMA